MVYNNSNDLGRITGLATMGVFSSMIETIILTVVALGVGIVWGRAVEGAKRDSNQPTAFSLDAAQKQGYMRARLSVDPSKMLTMDEMLLALHRIEGTIGAVNDNFSDLQLLAKKYGAEE